MTTMEVDPHKGSCGSGSKTL